MSAFKPTRKPTFQELQEIKALKFNRKQLEENLDELKKQYKKANIYFFITQELVRQIIGSGTLSAETLKDELLIMKIKQKTGFTIETIGEVFRSILINQEVTENGSSEKCNSSPSSG